MPVVDVPEKGQVSFPDTMSSLDMETAINDQWPDLKAKAGRRGKLLDDRKAALSEQKRADLGVNLTSGAEDVGTSVVKDLTHPVGYFANLAHEVDRLMHIVPQDEPRPFDADKPIVSAKMARAVLDDITDALDSGRPVPVMSEGAKQFVSEFTSGLSSPEMASALLAGKSSETAAKLVGGYFATHMALTSGDAIRAYRAAPAGPEKDKAALEAVATMGFPLLISAHANAPKVSELAKQVLPESVSELEGKNIFDVHDELKREEAKQPKPEPPPAEPPPAEPAPEPPPPGRPPEPQVAEEPPPIDTTGAAEVPPEGGLPPLAEKGPTPEEPSPQIPVQENAQPSDSTILGEEGKPNEVNQPIIPVQEAPKGNIQAPPTPETELTFENWREKYHAAMKENISKASALYKRASEMFVQRNMELAGDARAVRFQSKRDPKHSLLVSPSVSEPGKWQLTRIDEGLGPTGHDVFNSRENAIRYATGGQRVEGQPGWGQLGDFEVVKAESPEAAPKVVPTPEAAKPQAEAPKAEALSDQLRKLWPGITDREVAEVMAGPFSDRTAAKYDSLPKETQDRLEKWFADNESELSKVEDDKDFERQMQPVKGAEDPINFADSVIAAIENLTRNISGERSESIRKQVLTDAAEIAKERKWKTSDIKGAFGLSLKRTYGADAKEMFEYYFRPFQPEKAKVAPEEMFSARRGEGETLWDKAARGDEKALDDLAEEFSKREGEPEELGREHGARPSPHQVFSAEEFERVFTKAFADRDFDKILNTIKASSVDVWKPLIRKFFAAQAKGDATAALKADWLRHVVNGTRPADAKPPPKPHTPPPRPGPAPQPPRPGPGPGPRPGGAPPPPPPKPPKPPPVRIKAEPLGGGPVKSPYAILESFEKALGKAYRIRKLGARYLGVYRPGSTLTAGKYAGDLDTAAHELAGHTLDDKYGISASFHRSRSSPYDAELAQFWPHGSVSATGYRSTMKYKRYEGVAEFARAYVMNPAAAMKAAPKFGAYWESKLPPEVLSAVREFSNDVRRWVGEDPLKRTGLNVRMDAPTRMERLMNAIHGKGYGLKFTAWDSAREMLENPLWKAVKGSRHAAKMLGLTDKAGHIDPTKLDPEGNFELLASLLPSHESRLSDELKNGLVPQRVRTIMGKNGELEVERLTDPDTGKPMNQEWLLEPMGTDKGMADMEANMKDVSAYMIAQRTLEKLKGKAPGSRVSGIGAGIIDEAVAARQTLADAAKDPARLSMLKEAARRYRLWAETNLQMLVDSGRLSTEAKDQIVKANEFYVDMHRLSAEFDIDNWTQRTGGTSVGTARDLLKRFRGSALQTDNVYANLLDQTDSIQKEATRNQVMQSYNYLLEQVREMHGANLHDLDQIGSEGTSKDLNTIKVYKDGKAHYWKYAPDIYETLKGLGELGSHAAIHFVTAPIRVIRYMITHGPGFIFRNPVRDTLEQSVVSRHGRKPTDILKGYTKAELSRYEVMGGGQFGNYQRSRYTWNRELKKTMREMSKEPENIFLSPLKLKHGWERLAESSEKLGRLAEFRRAFDHAKTKLGYDDYNASLYAAAEARGLLDFAKMGTLMRTINQFIPFSNAHMQAMARSARGFRENPKAFAVRWATNVLLPTMAVMLWNRARKDDWEEYQQLPAYQKDFFWNLKLGRYWLRIPKPHEQGVLASGAERLLEGAMGAKHTMQGYGSSVANALSPVGSVVDMTGPLKTAIELKYNRDSFRNHDIVPAYEKDLKPELRKGEVHASKLGQGIAHAIRAAGLDVDSRQVDYVLQSFGGLGQMAVDFTGSRPLGEAAVKSIGYSSNSPAAQARDVVWVYDWAKHNGKVNSAEIRALTQIRNAYYAEKNTEKKEVLAKRLRETATRLRGRLDD